MTQNGYEDPYQQFDPYRDVQSAPPQPQRGGPGKFVALGVVLGVLVVLAVVAAMGFGWFLRGGFTDTAAAPKSPTSQPQRSPSARHQMPSTAPSSRATFSSSSAPTTAPAEAPTPTPRAAQDRATVVASTGGSAPATPTTARAVAAGAISEAEASSEVTTYLATVVSDPSRGWQHLSAERRAGEDFASYTQWWGSLASAQVEHCRYDAAASLMVCDLVTRSRAGLTGVTRGVKFPLIREDGGLRIDTIKKLRESDKVALDELRRLRDASLSGLTFDERWVAELSAKSNGISDPLQIAANGTNTFFYPDILEMHRALAGRFPDIHLLMLHGSNWGKQNDRDLWYTIADAGFGSKEAVQTWCASAFPELSGESLRNQCSPRQLKAPHRG